MLNIKFCGNRPPGSGEDFWRVLTIRGSINNFVNSFSVVFVSGYFLLIFGLYKQ